MTLKYLNLTGLNALVSAIKTWVLSRIPTKTSELTNDANFITSNDLPTNHVTTDTAQTVTGQKTWTAEQTFSLPIVGSITGTASKAIADEDGTNIKSGYVNVAGNQTVTGNKEFTGNNTFNNILPNATNTYSLGSSSYQWSSVYAQSYYYNGTEFLNKFVTTDTNQEIGGTKAFTGSIRPYGLITHLNQSLEKGTIPSSSRYGGIIYNDKTFANNVSHRFADQVAVVNSSGTAAISFAAYKWETNSQLKTEIVLGYPLQENTFLRIDTDEVIPGTTGVTDLGTSTNKWKTLNGINPGALGIPSSSYVAIDTTNWDLTGATSQSYTPTVHGWLFISIQNIAGNYLSVVGGRGAISIDGTGVQSGLRAMLPVIANESVAITVKTGSIFAARFYPMLGNV